MQVTWLMSVLGAYLCGAIPFGLLLGWLRGVDIRQHGSGNIGATNCGRVLGRKWGIICVLLDALKGAVPVLIAGWVLEYLGRVDLSATDAWRWLSVALAAVLGHMFPMWLKFRGGKGVATGLGVILALYPGMTIPAVGAAATWVITALVSRYVSLASVAAAGMLPVFVILRTVILVDGDAGAKWRASLPFLVVGGAMGALVIYRHRGNIGRLIRGTEPKWGTAEGDLADTTDEGA